MIRLLLLNCFLFLTVTIMANTIIVKNIDELKMTNENAKPGDIVILQNGEWKNVTISLDCQGTKERPITFRAQTAGKVLITGNSRLKLGGIYIIVDGLYFVNGYAGKDAVISFRVNKEQLANGCRVTNCVINDFNNPKRMEENNWVLFYGKGNTLDHCSFIGKKNMGVLLAVILDDERSRSNYHKIEYNYFGKRIPLASNGGEIIRVGVSQHCQFNSNTQITSNLFEHCDGETEIVSIKSCRNFIGQNIFKECQGSVVLRHGDSNTVIGNYFIGNDKPGTGGIRVINKGQEVAGNILYKCRGTDFRSPMAIMNGIPNSPAHRYVQVTDAKIFGNVFFECAPLSFCEGSDTERTLPPERVNFASNIFYNTRDSIIYRVWDNIGGFNFAKNRVNEKIQQFIPAGFDKTGIANTGNRSASWNTYIGEMPSAEKKAYANTGAKWFPKKIKENEIKPLPVDCATAADIYKQLSTKTPVTIRLTGREYILVKPFFITKYVRFTGNKAVPVTISTGDLPGVFIIAGNGNLSLDNLSINGAGVKAINFISNDSTGSSDHFNLSMKNCLVQNLDRQQGCQNIFYAYKSMIADSIIFHNNSFVNNNCHGIMMREEKDNKGYYNAEKIIITQNNFGKQTGTLMDIYRGGNDESTMGPSLTFSHNKISYSKTIENNTPLIRLYGVQRSVLEKNIFAHCNDGSALILFEDVVRASHLFRNNEATNSGRVITDRFVQSENNIIP